MRGYTPRCQPSMLPFFVHPAKAWKRRKVELENVARPGLCSVQSDFYLALGKVLVDEPECEPKTHLGLGIHGEGRWQLKLEKGQLSSRAARMLLIAFWYFVTRS